jgi:hypothetical protein
MSAAANAVVPFEHMERMAITVAKSNLFGMKTPEQALALMCLAQAEGVHPMIAVRDYHIIDGKPSLKADTMLARFLESGGAVEWHCMTDQKCDATFHHPKSLKPVRLDWTIERATTAGLAQKTNWRGYARAMLRSRVIAEGVRACNPGVIVGKYTPEELEAVEVIQRDASTPALAAIDAPSTPAGDAVCFSSLRAEVVEGHMTAIGVAPSLDVLKRVYAEAYSDARDGGDEKRLRMFVSAYEARKAELSSIDPGGRP